MVDAIARLLPAKLPEPVAAEAYAPSNIALSKYWGKRDAVLNLPLNSSLSISLADWGTTTKIEPADRSSLIFNGEPLVGTPFALKVWTFVNLLRRNQDIPLRIETTNSIPTAAGLASSASGFAALTKALASAFQLALRGTELSMISRLGSGSATRSFWHGFVRWERGQAADGSDSFAQPVDAPWPEFRIALIPVDTGPKAQSSRDGMTHTVETSPLFPHWPEQAEADCKAIEAAIRAQDFSTLGAVAEANSLAMHATMMAARPALTYLKPHSWEALNRLWQARAQGLEAYATMDAGANVKLIFLAPSEPDIRALFPAAQIIDPFGYSPE
ncbi:MAG: diphosphomevalonate decarboxylase [Pseudomonadota bacterium]